MKSYSNRVLRPIRIPLIVASVCVAGSSAYAQFSLTGTSYTQNFDLLDIAGTTTTVIPGWFVGTGTSSISGTTLTVGTGSATAGGNYNFGIAGTNAVTDRALGSLASGATQRNTEFRFTNNTGQNISAVEIRYDGEQWRVGGSAAVNNQLTLQFSFDGLTFSNLGAAFNFDTPIDNAAAGAALDGNLAANRVADIGGVYTLGSELSVGQTAFLRWADIDNASSDNAMALDNFRLAVTLVAPSRTVTWSPITGEWDTTSLHWNNGATAVAFQTDDTVVFDDTGLTSGSNVQIQAAGVTPRATRFTNTTGTYTLTGGAISGSGSLTKSGLGKLVLGSANTYSGTTSVNDGTLSFSADDQLGAAAAPLALGTAGIIETTGSLTLNASRSVSGTGKVKIAPSTTLAIAGPTTFGAITLTDTGSLSFTGTASPQITNLTLEKAMFLSSALPVLISGSVNTIYDSGTATISAPLNFGTSSTSIITVVEGSAPIDLILSGGISMTGTGRLTKQGDGTLEISGSNSYSGLRIGTAGTLPANGGTVILHDADDFGTLQMQFNAGTIQVTGGPVVVPIGVSIGAGQFPDGATFSGSAITFTGASSLFKATGSTYSHKITANANVILQGGLNASSGTGTSDGLIFAGSATVSLPATVNTIIENLIVDGGTLEVSGALTGATLPSITVRNLGTLTGISSGVGGVGVVSIENGIASGGRLAPGTTLDATGALTIGGDLIIKGPNPTSDPILPFGGDLFVDVAGVTPGNFDQLNVTGSVSLGGTLNLTLQGGYVPAMSDTFTLILNDGTEPVIGTFAGLPEGAQVGGTGFYISYAGGQDANDVVLTAVPEPTVSLLLLAGMGFFMQRRRRA